MAKNNEAKILFTADTGKFNDSIAQSKAEMNKLRAEMSANAQQMKETGVTVDGLRQKQEILAEQQKAAQKETEALSAKLEVAKRYFGENSLEALNLETKLIKAQTAEAKITSQIEKCNKQLADQIAAQIDTRNATEKLTDEIDEQQEELDRLKNAYKDAVLSGEDTAETQKELAKQIKEASEELAKSKKKMDEASDAADELDRSLDDTGDGFTVLKGAASDLISEGIQFAIGKINELTEYMWGLAEATRESRQDFATLTTAFANVGLSTETATDTWKELYKVFGEDDRAVEAANNIARMSKNQQDLDKWVTITTGIWGTYQDALPVEGLAEAAGETAKVGTVTGGLADALNWSSEAAVMFAGYMSEDVVTAEDAFNVALSECNTEQERQKLITDTLTKLYGGAANTYRDTAGALMEANGAAADAIIQENALGEAMQPANNEWSKLTSQLKEAAAPALTAIAGVLADVLGWLNEHPVALKIVAATVAVFTAAITALAIAMGIYAIAQWSATAALAPFILPILAIVAAIAAVIAIIILVIEYWDQIVAAVKVAVQAVGQFFVDLWNSIVNIWNSIMGFFASIGQWIYDNVIAPIAQFFTDLWNGIVSAFHTVIDPWIEIVKRIAAIIYESVIQPVAQFFTDLWNGITGGLKAAWDWIVGIFSAVAGWINEKVIEPVTGFFSKLWNGFTDGAKNAWNGVKSVFSKVGQFFSDIFNVVKDKIVSVFQAGGKVFNNIKDGIVNVFKTVVNGIIKGINTVIALPFKGLNKILDTIHGVSIVGVQPFSWLTWRAPVPQIPLLAEGGILTKPTLNIAGEAGPEAIVPIDKLQTYISGAIDRATQMVDLQGLVVAIEDLANRAIELHINGQKFATATAGDTDSVNGSRVALSKRGLAL